jgi:hypothetical protein
MKIVIKCVESSHELTGDQGILLRNEFGKKFYMTLSDCDDIKVGDEVSHTISAVVPASSDEEP